MIYSVWDGDRRLYDYYEADEKRPSTHAPRPRHLRASQLGVIPEEAAWPLPTDARLVGSGELPRGYVARTPGSPMGGIDLTYTSTLLLLGGASLTIYYLLRRRRG